MRSLSCGSKKKTIGNSAALTRASIIKVFPTKVLFNKVHKGRVIARCEKSLQLNLLHVSQQSAHQAVHSQAFPFAVKYWFTGLFVSLGFQHPYSSRPGFYNLAWHRASPQKDIGTII